MKDKISQLIEMRKAMGDRIEKLEQLNAFHNAALIARLKSRYILLDKKIANLWE